MKSILTSFLHRTATFCAAGLALAAAGAPHAKADIIYSGTLNLAVPQTTAGVYLDLTTGATATNYNTTFDINPYFGSGQNGSFLDFYFASSGGAAGGVLTAPDPSGTVQSPYAVLAAGSLISSASTFGIGNSDQRMANYRAGVNGGYLGVRFVNDNTNQIDYGWVQFTTGSPTGAPATIVSYAFNNVAGQPIFAGQTSAVPEPGTVASLGALAAGALGLRQWRRRRQAAA